MAIIVVRDGIETEVDDKYVNYLSSFTWYPVEDGSGKIYINLYIKFERKDRPLLHRVVMGLSLDRVIPRHEWVDHIDGNSLKNVENNLRICTPSQNSQNRGKSPNNPTGYKGVDRLKSGKYRAQITTDWLYKYLGTHNTAEDAARAYDDAARKYHKEFAVLNFPDEPFEKS